MVDLTDPEVPLTWELHAQMTSEQRTARERRFRQRMLAWPDRLDDATEAHIDDVGLERTIEEIAAWVRLVLKDPDTTASTPLLAPRMVERWRTCSRNLAGDLTRHAPATKYAQQVIRDMLGLRRLAKPPAALDDFHASEIHAAAWDTAEHLAALPNVGWPPPRRRRRRFPAPPPVRPPVDVAERERARAAYAREKREWDERQNAERIRRLLEGEDESA